METERTNEAAADDLESLARRVDQAIVDAQELDAPAREKALALKDAIEAFHKAGLVKIVRALRADPRGKELLFALLDEPEIYVLFLMHGIVQADVTTRVHRAIEQVRPYLQSHGGDVALVSVATDRVQIRLLGACNGCSMSAATLRGIVEEALREHAPEVAQLEVLPTDPAPAIIALDRISVVTHEEAGWVRGPALSEIVEGRPYRLDLEACSVVVLKYGERLIAFRNACAHQGLPLDGGIVDVNAGTITCPWHGWCYDGTSGECLTVPHAQLESFPLRVEDGAVWIRPIE